MKIAYIITELNEGGAEHALEQVACILAEQGHQIYLTCLYGGTGAVGRRMLNRGLTINDLQMQRCRQVMRLLKLREWLRQSAPDIVHSWLFHAGMAARLTTPPETPLVHGLRVVQHRRWMVLAERWVRRQKVDSYACVSSAVRQFAYQNLKARKDICRVIENGINLTEFSETRRDNPVYDQLRGLTVARLAYQKGLDILLEALAMLPPDLPWSWTFVGREEEPQYARNLKKRAKLLKIDRRLQWHDPVPRSQLPEIYAQANLLALPSRWEGQANVVLEAMASGVPVITSNCAGIEDIKQHRADCLQTVEPNQSEQWAEALRRTWEKRNQLPRQAAAAFNVIKNYDWQQVAEQYRDLYQQVIQTKKSNGPAE